MTTLRLGDFHARTRAMGPGLRAAIWVAGCPFRCKGCATPEFLSAKSGQDTDVESVIAMVDAAVDEHGIEGVSFSGGEPFAQARALARIARHARSRGLSTLSWSGYVRAHLEGPDAPEGAAELLGELDVLIDGLFVKGAMEGDPLRGSSNQVLHLLSDRYDASAFGERIIEIRQKPDSGRIVVNGIADTSALRHVLRAFGASE